MIKCPQCNSSVDIQIMGSGTWRAVCYMCRKVVCIRPTREELISELVRRQQK